MVTLTAYMVATTAMIMGIQAIDHASAEEIKSVLEVSHVLPAAHHSVSVSAHHAASASLISAVLHANNVFHDINNLLSEILNRPNDNFFASAPSPALDDTVPSVVNQAPAVSSVVKPPSSIVSQPIVSSVISKAPASSVVKSASDAASSVIPNKEKINNTKRAIYDMDGDYSESIVVFPVSNVYSALDRASSVAASPLPSASVKAVLRARGAAMSSAASHASVSAHKASAALALAAPSHARRAADMPQVSPVANLDIADILRSRISSEIRSSISDFRSSIAEIVDVVSKHSDEVSIVKSALSQILPPPTPFPATIPLSVSIPPVSKPSVSLSEVAKPSVSLLPKGKASIPSVSVPSKASASSSESSKPSNPSSALVKPKASSASPF